MQDKKRKESTQLEESYSKVRRRAKGGQARSIKYKKEYWCYNSEKQRITGEPRGRQMTAGKI